MFIRTSIIDSHTYVWKEGMQDWAKIFQIEELKDYVNITHSEIAESLTRNKIQSLFSQKFDSTLENFYLSADGLWHIYNPITKTWSKQETVIIVFIFRSRLQLEKFPKSC